MPLTRRVRIQLVTFAVVSLVAAVVMSFGYMRLPSLLFGIGRYTVTMELPTTGGLYKSANVSYRGQEVGRVQDVELTDRGIEATLSLNSATKIPSDLDAQVHSQSAIGEQYVELIPRAENGAPLKNGDVIPADRTSVPEDINSLLDATDRGLTAIPGDSLKTVIDEGYAAFGGLGPDISRLVKNSTRLATGAKANLDSITTLIDQAKPLLDSQGDTSDSIHAWASHVADITEQLKRNDAAVRGILQSGPAAADDARALIDRLQPTLPVLLANLTGLADVAVTYHPNLEQLLVLAPQGIGILDTVLVPDLYLKPGQKGANLTFDLNINLPPPCTTGYLPATQVRVPALTDYPPRPEGDLYCRVPQDSPFNVRGARNTPCETKPGKRAPTAKMCESDENYVPINDGYNWKGDPNATLSGQGIPQGAPAVPDAPSPPQVATPGIPPTAPPPIAVAHYDPATGTYVGPDGHVYTQSDLAQDTPKEHTWQTMLAPPTP